MVVKKLGIIVEVINIIIKKRNRKTNVGIGRWKKLKLIKWGQWGWWWLMKFDWLCNYYILNVKLIIIIYI